MSRFFELAKTTSPLYESNQPRFLLRCLLPTCVLAVGLGMALDGRLEEGLVVGGTACALVGIFWGFFGPRNLLKTLFLTAPLLWGLGDLGRSSNTGLRTNLPMIVGFAVICAFAPQIVIRDQDSGIERIRKLVIALALACVPAIFFAADLSTGVGTYVRVMLPFIVMFGVCRSIRDDRDAVTTARMMIWSVGATAALLLVGFLRGELWVTFDGFAHLGGMNIPPQSLGSYLAVMVSVVGLHYLVTRQRMHLLLFLPVLAALYLTYNRTSWIGAVLVLFLFVRAVNRRWSMRLLVCALLLGFAYSSAVSASFLRYSSGMSTLEEINKVFNGRLLVDFANVSHYLDAPWEGKLLGLGFMQSLEVSEELLNDRVEIHSDYLAFLIEAGVFALAFYLATLGALWLRARRAAREGGKELSRYVCGSTASLMLAFIIMGIPRAWYHEVIGNLYVFGQMGLMLRLSQQPISGLNGANGA